MFSLIIDAVSLLSSALLVGAMFCVWMVFNPARLDAARYIILQQQGIRTLHPSMPRLGAFCVLLSVVAAFAARENRPRMAMLIAAAFCLVVSGLITRFANMPINAMVIHWNSAAPPDHWTELRDQWWRWHCMRLGSGLIGLVLMVLSTFSRELVPGAAAFAGGRSLFHALIEAFFLLI